MSQIKPPHLGSVNWDYGLKLTPDHFKHLEHYFDQNILWVLRYMHADSGLVGGGARMGVGQLGDPSNDPSVELRPAPENLQLIVSNLRAVTPGGHLIETSSRSPLVKQIPMSDLAGTDVFYVHVFRSDEEEDKVVERGERTRINPVGEPERFHPLQIMLSLEPVVYHTGIAVACCRKRGRDFVLDPDFIPACVTLGAHSRLWHGYQEIIKRLGALTARASELHRSMRTHFPKFREWDIFTELDLNEIGYVNRLVVAAHDCLYSISDPVQSPRQLFGHLRRLFHNVAVFLDMSPDAVGYLQELAASDPSDMLDPRTDELDFQVLLGMQTNISMLAPKHDVYSDLNVDIKTTIRSLQLLQQVEKALEAKYINFRANRILSTLRFFFDGEIPYVRAGRDGNVQKDLSSNETLFTFANLSLEGRHKYRLVLAGDEAGSFPAEVPIRVFLNDSGMKGQAHRLSCTKAPGQFNFDFEIPTTGEPTIADIRVAVKDQFPFRAALLYMNKRILPSERSQNTSTSQGRSSRFSDPEPPPRPGTKPRSGSSTNPPPGSRIQTGIPGIPVDPAPAGGGQTWARDVRKQPPKPRSSRIVSDDGDNR